MAAALQERLEEVGVHLARHLKARTGEKNLCIAGGVGLNGIMNYRILCEAGFDSVFIPPPAGDDGASLGAAQYLAHVAHSEPRCDSTFSPYLGSSWSEAEIAEAVARAKAKSTRVKDPATVAARLIADGKIIGWFQGRSEIGPRALGNRSILADARRADMKDKINNTVKFRESFRPFAPACLAEYAAEYFVIDHRSPYMLMVAPVRPEKRASIPAITHVDGTARIQTVTRRDNSIFFDLIQAFHGLTGTPIILNTSFNVKGEPIVDSPDEAVRCFESTALDALVIGSFVLEK
jgi:carbamoyltransferase